jgi:beta-lactamase class A|nr:MAG: beta-lactamase [Bacteroidota bacterium]
MPRLASILGLVLCLVSLARAQGERSLAYLEREIARLASLAGGRVGVGVVHIETGRRLALNGQERFPMASTYKVPIAIALLERVDRGELRLEDMVPVDTVDVSPGSGTLADLFQHPGVALSVRNLLELMMLISDNTATDICLRLVGGPEALRERLRQWGVAEGIRVDRPTKQLIADWLGLGDRIRARDWSLTYFRTLQERLDPEERRLAAARFDADERDTATPMAMAELLGRLFRGELLSPRSTALLLDILHRCRTGENRLKGLLPAGTPVAHKTGTIGGTLNDVGILTLPDGAGHVAIAVFIKSSDRDTASRERAIAEIARAVYDYFLFVRP